MGSVLLRTLAGVLLASALPLGAQPIITTVVGGGVGDGAPKQNMLMTSPGGLMVDPGGTLWIADSTQSRARLVSPAGTASTEAGNGDHWAYGKPSFDSWYKVPLGTPRAFARLPNGNVLITDPAMHGVWMVDYHCCTERVVWRALGMGDGSIIFYFGDDIGGTSGSWYSPSGVAVHPTTGEAYVSDSGHNVIRKVHFDSNSFPVLITRFAGVNPDVGGGSTAEGIGALTANLSSPQGLAFDSLGNLYVAETGRHRVRKIDTAGNITTVAGNGTAGFSDGAVATSRMLNTPTQLLVGPSNELYIVDEGNNRIRKLVGTTISTVAGNGSTGNGGDGGLATAATMTAPGGVAIDDVGNLYVSVPSAGKVRKITVGTGQIDYFAGNGQVLGPDYASFSGDQGFANQASLNYPVAVHADASGNFLVADNVNKRVRKVTGPANNRVIDTLAGNGTSTVLLGGPATSSGLTDPVAVASDALGNAYIADRSASSVYKVNTSGVISLFAGTPATANLGNPAGLAVDSLGRVYISSSAQHRIVRVNSDGSGFTTVAGMSFANGFAGDGGAATSAQLNFPSGISVDAAGNLYIADTGNQRIRKVTSGGTISTVAGNGASGFGGDGGLATGAALSEPVDVEVDPAGNIYIADRLNYRIRKVLPDGTIRTIAGSLSFFDGDGGLATGAHLSMPYAIKRDTAGNLYVADAGSNRVRRIAPSFPYAPAIGTAVAGSSQLTLTFTAPDDGNSPILEYQAICNATVMNSGTSSPLVVTGLTDGIAYTCKVVARNAIGWGFESADANTVTPGSPPSITSTAPGPGTVGVSYTHTYTASGTPASAFTLTAGSLPPGLTLSAGGTLSGTPANAGVFTGTVTAANGLAPDSTQSFSITIAKASTTVTLVSDSNPSIVGGAVTFTATLTGASPAPTGSIAFKDGGAAISGCGAVAIASLQAGCTSSALAVGTRSITAEYSGDAQYNVATSNTVSQAVKPLAPAITSPTAASTIAPNPAITGTGTNGATVTVREGATTVCTATVNGAGAWSCASTLANGSHTIDAIQALSGQSGAPSAAVTFTVQASYLLTVAKDGAGSGTVSGNSGGLTCGATCSVSYTQGTVVALTATPTAGSALSGWGGACSGTGGCSVTMDAAKTVTATFDLAQHTVTTSAGPNGSITPNSRQVAHGATTTFNVTPNAGFALASLTGCGGTYSQATASYTTGPITADCTVSATFVSLGSDLGTTLTANPATASIGQDVTFTLTISSAGPEAGEGVGTWIVLPAGATFISATAGCNPTTLGPQNIVACIPDAVPIGATPSFTFVLRPTVAGTLTVKGEISSSKPDPDATNNESTASVSVSANPSRMGNISTRMQVLTGNDVLIGGFVIGGSTTKRVAIVATGPSLAAFGITNALANPTLRLVRSSDQAVLATSDDWQSAPNASDLTAAGFAPSNSLEAAILIDLAPGAYTAIVEGAGGVTGVSVIGVYEVNHPETPLINISTRGRVLTGNDVMIGGFIVNGDAPKTLAIVATGPSLAAFGIASPLANPTLTLVRSSDQAVIATNDDWQTAANQADLAVAGFAPANALEAALLVTLPPGAYTAIVQGAGGGTGVAVIGVYAVP